MDGLYEQLRFAAHAVWTRRWFALGVAWAICLVGWLAVALVPNSYEAKARIFVEPPKALPSAMGSAPQDRNGNLVRLRQTLVSSDTLERVVRRTDLNLQVASDSDLAAQVAALRQSIKVTAQPDDVFEVTASSSVAGLSNAQNARTAAAVVEALIDSFLDGAAAGDRAQAEQTLAFLNEEIRQREARLREAEQRRVEFETQYMGLLPGEGSIAQRVSAARMELASVEQQLTAAQGAVAAARGQLAGTPSAIIGGEGGATTASGRIAALEGQISQLRARGWTDNHPDILATRAQIARLQPQAEAERRSGAPVGTPNPLYVSLRSMLAEREAQASALSARRQQLQSDLAQLSAKQTAEPELVAEQTRLNRDYDVLKRQYDKLIEDREQIRLRVDAASKSAPLNFRVIDRPSIPTVPATPNRPLLLSLVLVVALGGGVAAAFARSQLQPTFPSQGKLEQVTGLPVLGSVSALVTDTGRAIERQRLRWFAGSGAALGGAYALLMVVEFWQRSQVI